MKRREWWARAVALGRWAVAIGLAIFGAVLTSFLAVIATGLPTVSWLRLGTYCLFAFLLQVGHAVLVVRTARRGARLYSSHEAWNARFSEARNIWHALTSAMPLRAHDLFWVYLSALLGFIYPLIVLSLEIEEPGEALGVSLQLAAVAALLIVMLLSGALLVLLDRAIPALTLARWASDQMINPRWPFRRPPPPAGPRVAPVLSLYANRRLNRLPSPITEEVIATCNKLAAVSRVAYTQQNTRQSVRRVMRDVLQYSARMANSKDPSEAARMANAWLNREGLGDFSAAPYEKRRPVVTVRGIGTFADLIKHLAYLVGFVTFVWLLIQNDAGLPEIVKQFK